MLKTTTELMLESMERHGITTDELRAKAKELALEEIDRDFDRFVCGGRISLSLAAAIIVIIVRKKYV